jgi:FixJ family two-component response regulator
VTTAPVTVAVVDDDHSVRRALERLLRIAGYRVVTFESAREFLTQELLDDLGCLVLDVQMPEQGGLALYESLTAANREVSVVFITGHSDLPVSARAMQAGAVDVLLKPPDECVLLDAVARAVALQRERKRGSVERS